MSNERTYTFPSLNSFQSRLYLQLTLCLFSSFLLSLVEASNEVPGLVPESPLLDVLPDHRRRNLPDNHAAIPVVRVRHPSPPPENANHAFLTLALES
ncbi:hypothetical protein DsansV1_C07g0072111 [Dioscorea sansibarensis]